MANEFTIIVMPSLLTLKNKQVANTYRIGIIKLFSIKVIPRTIL